jgi:hypothetical protein
MLRSFARSREFLWFAAGLALSACGEKAPSARWQQPAPPSVARPLDSRAPETDLEEATTTGEPGVSTNSEPTTRSDLSSSDSSGSSGADASVDGSETTQRTAPSAD